MAICVGGVLAIKSASHADVHAAPDTGKQILGIVVGFIAMIGLALVDYEAVVRRYARGLYAVNLLLLVLVLKGHSSHGAARWISIGHFELQPSEFAKVILICTLALSVAMNLDTIAEWRTVAKSLLHMAVPVLLVARQHDLGKALVLMAIWFGVMAMAGARTLHLLAILLAGIVLFSAMWRFNVLHTYQKNRLEVFVNPGADPLDAGYHLHQSIIAIGSGGVIGEGYEEGKQSNGRFIPEQPTDFIFTVVGEEGGFVGCVLLLGLYLLLLERGVAILAACEDPLGRLLAAGVISMLTFHAVVNSGMTMGIMPVVGVPLPFFSYGLSSLIVNMSAVGLLLSVDARRHRMMF